MWRADSSAKTPMLQKIEGGRRRGRQDKMVGWHHRLYGCEFEQALGVDEEQGILVCCSSWGCKDLDAIQWPTNNNSLKPLRMMPSKCCTQYVSKSGRFHSGHRIGKGQSSSQFPRRVILNNVLTIGRLHSSPMLVKSCLKSCMLDFNAIRVKNV